MSGKETWKGKKKRTKRKSESREQGGCVCKGEKREMYTNRKEGEEESKKKRGRERGYIGRRKG